jgi:transcriptional regulator MraZ
MFRGNCPTRLDEKGRLKVPADFKREIDENYQGRFYLTSFDGKIAKLYPLREWESLEKRLLSHPGSNQTVQKFLEFTNLHGQMLELDAQGRLTIAERLRQKFGLKDEVAVSGHLDHVEIEDLGEHVKRVEANQPTAIDLDELPLRKRD